MIFSARILCAVTFPIFWWLPPGMGDTGNFIWLLVTGLLFYTAFTIFAVPYHALGYEIAPGYNEKTRLFAVRTAIGTLNGLAVAWVFPLITSGWLGPQQQSAHLTGIAIGVLLGALAIIPAIGLRETTTAKVLAQPKVPLLTSLKVAGTSRPFLYVAGAASLAVTGLNTVTVLGTDVNVYYVHGGDIKAGAIVGAIQFTVSTIFIILCTPFMTLLSKAVGKRQALMLCLFLAIAGTISKWFFYTPEHPYWLIGVVFFLGPANAGLRTFADAMVADVCEYESVTRNVRLEAMFGAVYTWLLKSGIALATIVSGFILVFTGFSVDLGGGQSETTLLWLRLLFSFFPLIALIISCLLLARYSLSAELMADVRRRLDARDIEDQTPLPE